MKFSERLKQLRNEVNWTQDELASRIGKTRSAVAGYETEGKRPDYGTLTKIAEVFDVSIDYLLDHDAPPQESEDCNQYRDFMRRVKAFFMDNKIGEKDKEALFKDITELFWKAKEMESGQADNKD